MWREVLGMHGPGARRQRGSERAACVTFSKLYSLPRSVSVAPFGAAPADGVTMDGFHEMRRWRWSLPECRHTDVGARVPHVIDARRSMSLF